MKAFDVLSEENFGTNPKRPARAGSRSARGHEPQKRYVTDRKTGKQYDPDEEFDKLKNSPEFQAQMKRMATKEGAEERKKNATWAQITDYEKRAKATKNDIRKAHYLKMASDLRSTLKTSDDEVNEIAGAFPSPSTRKYWADQAAASNRAEAARQAELQRQANAAAAAKLAQRSADVDRLNKVSYHGADAPKPTNATWDGDSDFLDLDGTQYARAMRMPISGDVPPDIKLISTSEGRQVYIWTRNSLKGNKGHYFYPAENPKTIQEVSKDTLDQYVTKAVDAHGHADFSARASKDDPTKRSYHKDQAHTAEKRRQGISRALDRMSKKDVAEGEVERQHGDIEPWAYWGSPERVAKKLYQIHKGAPISKDEVKHLWKVDGPDRMTKFMLKPDLHAILSNYEAMSDQGPLFKEASIQHKHDTVPTSLKPGDEVACNAGLGRTIFGIVKRIGRKMIHVQTRNGEVLAFAPQHVELMTPTYWQDKAEANKPKWAKKKAVEEQFCSECGGSLAEHGKASRALCISRKPDDELGASMLASCKSQGLRARDGNKSHKLGKTAKSRVKVGGHKIKGNKYGGPLPDWS